MATPAKCEICGHPMPKGEEMFKYHGHSGPCPVPPPTLDTTGRGSATWPKLLKFVGLAVTLAAAMVLARWVAGG